MSIVFNAAGCKNGSKPKPIGYTISATPDVKKNCNIELEMVIKFDRDRCNMLIHTKVMVK